MRNRVFILLILMLFYGAGPAVGEEGKPALIAKIEEATGIPVTQGQREAIAEASQKMLRAKWERQRQFVAELKERGTIPAAAERALTPVDGLPFDFTQDPLTVITRHAEEPPDQQERDTVRFLDAQRKRDLGRLREEYAETLSGITDLPAAFFSQKTESPGIEDRE